MRFSKALCVIALVLYAAHLATGRSWRTLSVVSGGEQRHRRNLQSQPVSPPSGQVGGNLQSQPVSPPSGQVGGNLQSQPVSPPSGQVGGNPQPNPPPPPQPHPQPQHPG